DKYEIVRRIGAGGMGEIFLARQHGPEGFLRSVVLKCVLPSLSNNAEFVRMFLDEARVAARISHPNVVQIIELERDDRGFFIAMEYVDGWNLRTVLRVMSSRQVQMPTEIACRLISDVCAGLHAAHTLPTEDGTRRGVVHRDVSPANILISQAGIAKLTDFGIAKAMGSLQVTKPGTMKGKAPYMAPEQILSKDA